MNNLDKRCNTSLLFCFKQSYMLSYELLKGVICMGLFKAIGYRVNNEIQKVLFFNELRKECNNPDVNPINLGYLTLLGKDYLRGYPASFYLFFDKMPEIRINDHELLKMDDEISSPLFFLCYMTGTNTIKCDQKAAGTYALFSRIKHYSPNAKFIKADVRLWGTSFYVQDEEYVYEPLLLTKYPIDVFNRIYNPKNKKDITDSVLVRALNTFLTSDVEKEKEDFSVYVDADVLDDLYVQANNITVYEDEEFSRFPDYKTLRKSQLDDFFKDIGYKYGSGVIDYK